ncbi:MAG: PaaI family thioesterase [Gammaproteobacteria bacterium]|nr:PaaI family thioesterase [Gammaproteobacteria bacterium]MCY4344560.1 PaaI family thioesterase [Gammaproteobacteria bacterium]
MSVQGTPEAVLNAVAADGPLLAHHGIRFVSAREGRAVLQAKAKQVMVNAGGRVHGGLAFLMADTACAYALRSISPGGVTQNANMNYLNAVEAGMTLEAVAEVVKAGTRIASLSVEVRAGSQLVAYGIFNFVVREA